MWWPRGVGVMDWTKCIICQEETLKPLKCPMNSLAGTPAEKKETYETFLSTVEEFRTLDALPVKLLFESDISAEELIENKASWHKACHLKFASSKLSKAKKRKETASVEVPQRVCKRASLDKQVCLFCTKGNETEQLHSFCTFDADSNVRTMVTELQDTELLSRMASGDLIAIEAKYHLKCLTSLRNRYRAHVRKCNPQEENISEKMKEGVAFIELVNYIEKCVDNGTLLFKLSELHSMYVGHLGSLGIHKAINKTRLKEQLLKRFPEAQAQSEGRNVIVVFESGMRSMLRDALKKRDYTEDAFTLAKAADIIRRDIFQHDTYRFSGSFSSGCQEAAVPASLIAIVSMILNGTKLDEQDGKEPQACRTIAQVMMFNTKKKAKAKTEHPRHSLEREPPSPLYIGLAVHKITRSEKLVQLFHKLGLSVSYDRVLQIEDQLTTALCEQFAEDGIVCPASLRRCLFTISAIDNIDHNLTSMSASTSFHGTGISLFQSPTVSNSGEERPSISLSSDGRRKHNLPDSFAIVPAAELKTSSVKLPPHPVSTFEMTDNCLALAIKKEDQWISHALPATGQEEPGPLTWSTYHASSMSSEDVIPAICTMLPVFYEKAATPAMVKHGMTIVQQATAFLNPGQVPVTFFDQQLYAIAKYAQWAWPDTHGEDKHVVMMGGLHMEMALWSTLGDLLEGSGWTTALVDGEVASSGVASGMLNASHLTRTR